MQEVLVESQKLEFRLHQLHDVIHQVIKHNQSCFVDFTVYKNESYKRRRRRCFSILKANEYLKEVQDHNGKSFLCI